MKDRVERFVILPFSMGCSSHSSVAVAVRTRGADRNKKQKPPADLPMIKRGGEEREEDYSSFDEDDKKINEASGIFASSKASANGSDGIYRFIKSLKSFSHLFVGYREDAEDTEAEMEIGFPTDVKHVTHIGLDGTMTTSDPTGGGWENLLPSNVASTTAPSSFPFGRFQLAAI